jgi:hypothetical protein
MSGKILFMVMTITFLISIGIAIYDRYHNNDTDLRILRQTKEL